MKQITSLDELKQIELDILQAVHDFCQAEGIVYSMAFGTLLGAVRHQGFIPWDDDIDIVLLRDDYERFIRTFQHPYYRVYDCMDSSPDIEEKGKYCLPFAKVADIRTVLKEDVVYDTPYGVYIDVFPVDDMPENPKEFNQFSRRKGIISLIGNLKYVKVGNRSFYKNAVLWLSHLLLAPISILKVARWSHRYCQKYNHLGKTRAGVVVPYGSLDKEIMDRDIYTRVCPMPFEGRQFNGVKRSHDYLTARYGDYMQLPPEKDRVAHHAFEAWWKE